MSGRIARQIERPEVGWWMIRLGRGKPEVPACIQYERTTFEPGEPDNLMDRSAILTARVSGEIVPWERVWHSNGRRISHSEYLYQLADAAHAREHRPDDPKANPHKAIDLLTVPIPF